MTGTTRWSDGREMVTLDYSHLTSVLWGVCKGFQARLDALEAWQAQQAEEQVKKTGFDALHPGNLAKPLFGARSRCLQTSLF